MLLNSFYKNDQGYIYIMRFDNYSHTLNQNAVYKIGKTTNKNDTIRNYERGSLIKSAFYAVNNMSMIENIILNVLAPWRISKNSGVLSEQILININLLKNIVGKIIQMVNSGYNIKIKVPRSVNNIYKYRNELNVYFWNELCIYLNKIYPNKMAILMEIDDYDNNYDSSHFDEFINKLI